MSETAANDGHNPRKSLDPQFKWALIAVVGLTVLSIGVSVGLAISYDEPSEQIDEIIRGGMDLFKIGAGAVFGLLGGKSLS